MREFNVGDVCRIRKWEDMAREFELDDDGDIYISDDAYFFEEMKDLCGKPFVIKEKRFIVYYNGNWVEKIRETPRDNGIYRYLSTEGVERYDNPLIKTWIITGDMLELDSTAGFNYNRGLNDAWETARKLILRTTRAIDAFGGMGVADIFDSYTAADAIDKIREYEEKKKAEAEIKVGDEVVEHLGKTTITSVVWYVSDERIFGMTNDGKWNACDKSDAHKTGRHFPQIAEVLKLMNEPE